MAIKSKTRRYHTHPPAFIDHLPIGEDLLKGKSQDRIANAIAELIRSNAPSTKLIGLDGPWGSGKSNVAKIVQSTLQDTHHFFFMTLGDIKRIYKDDLS